MVDNWLGMEPEEVKRVRETEIMNMKSGKRFVEGICSII